MMMQFRDRIEAGQLLAKRLTKYANRPDVLVLALPRGGVPVGYEVAQALHAPLDVFGIPDETIDAVATRELRELERRERAYRDDRPAPDVQGRTIILVDDGIATGSTMRASIEAVPAYLAKVDPPSVVRALGAELGWEIHSSDYVRKKMAGFPLHERSSAAARRRLYSAAMTEQTYDRLLTTAEAQVKKGHSVILDATFARREHRELVAEPCRKRGITWRLLEAQASNAAVKQRLRAREAKPDEVSDARLEDFDMLTRLYKPPLELPAGQYVKVRTSGPLDQTVTKALQSLARIQVENPCPSP